MDLIRGCYFRLYGRSFDGEKYPRGSRTDGICGQASNSTCGKNSEPPCRAGEAAKVLGMLMTVRS